jgi:hypothetical protein
MSTTDAPRRGDAATELVRSIVCPNCGQTIGLDEALRERLAADLIARRESDLRRQAEQAAAAKVRGELENRQAELEARAERVRELEDKLKEHQDAEKQLLRTQRELEDEKQGWELERERMRTEIRKQEREQAERAQRERYEELARRKDDDHKTEVRRLTEQIERMKAQLEEAARRGATGSRQEEGFARQEVFAAELRERFPDDQVTVTPRGQAGADVTQRVRSGGRECGVVVWECKRAAKWSSAWPGKLADDVRKAGAALGVIVSETLPVGMDGSGRVDDVWVCDFGSAAHLAAGLRWVLIAVAQYEAANAARAGTAGRVYDYIATGGFASRFEVISRTVETMMVTLAKEKRYYQQRWAEWERHIESATSGLYGIAADLVGLGAEVPPPLRAELPAAGLAALPGDPGRPATSLVTGDATAAGEDGREP